MIVAYVSKDWKQPLERLEDAHIELAKFEDLEAFVEFYQQSPNRDVVLVYETTDQDEIRRLREVSFKQNVYIVIIGPADPKLSLLAGKMGADGYLFEGELDIEALKEQLINSRKNVKERMGGSHISVFSGIQGGIGTTTVALHTAKLLADGHPERKVLFLDFATTKAVSNLFFDVANPAEGLANVAVTDYANTEMLQRILHKFGKNLYFVPGIQRHAEREELEKPENIMRILGFVEFARDYFNDIVIDLGVFEDLELKNRASELADSLYIIVEFSIPSISILKTQLDYLYRFGWAPKTNLLINRYDARDAFDVEEAVRIIRENESYPYKVDYMLPNDSKSLRNAWNEASLLTDRHPDTAFLKALDEFVERHFFADESPLPKAAIQERPGRETFGERLMRLFTGNGQRR